MNTRLRTVLRHAAGFLVCSALVFVIVYVAVLVRFASEYEREDGTTSLLSMTAHYTLQVLVFLPGLLESYHSLGSNAKVILSWINILFDGCVLYLLWSVIRGWRRRRHGDEIPKTPER